LEKNVIKNARQYRITKAQAEKFARALSEAPKRTRRNAILERLETDALRSQYDELRQELAEYDALQSGRRRVISVKSFDELPAALVKARIAAGLSQRELAQRLGLKEQQIQRYEATDYRSASLSRLQKVVKALGIQVHEEIFLPARTASTLRANKRA
jgi:ribosome-binding protein aMBF1 (putative translation factor)